MAPASHCTGKEVNPYLNLSTATVQTQSERLSKFVFQLHEILNSSRAIPPKPPPEFHYPSHADTPPYSSKSGD